MGETAAETLSEIDIAKSRIEQDLDVLEERLPERDELAQRAKQLGIAAAGTGGGLVVLWILVRRWRRLRAEDRQAQRQAELLAAKLPSLLDGDRRAPAPAPSSSASSVMALVVAIVALVVGLTQMRRSGS